MAIHVIQGYHGRMTEKPPRNRLIFDLTDDDKLLLEAVRVKLGLRSHAETLRSLIRSYPWPSVAIPSAVIETQALPDVRARAPIPPKASLAAVQLGPTPRAPGSGLKQKGQKR